MALQQVNDELIAAYDTTLEGWARALDLRDHETEDHCRRVTELTLRLAQAMGLAGEELLYIRWGALLHDIGKIAVPDAILNKPGPLTEEEWVIMRRHPEYAYNLLSPIPFLRPALEIPYSHHERWDGAGYPRGLRGADIPQAARLFAVVDVWDALRSDRAYRPALPTDQVITHLRANLGTHFDPAIVPVFLDLVAGGEH
jgi:putative nucleotidyltransferase with HDIG domain